MRKKLLVLFAAGVMATSLLAGCSCSTKTTTTTQKTDANGTTTTTTTTTAKTPVKPVRRVHIRNGCF